MIKRESFYSTVIRARLDIRIELRTFKKNYCCICGQKLKRRIKIIHYFYHTKNIIFKEIERHVNVITSVYYCDVCDYGILYNDQQEIKQQQDIIGQYVLPNAKNIIKDKIIKRGKNFI